MTPQEIVSAVILILGALTALFSAFAAFVATITRAEVAILREEMKGLRLENQTNIGRLRDLNALLEAATKRVNTALDTLGDRDKEVADGVKTLSGAAERIEKLRTGLEKDGDRATLDKVLKADDKDKKEQEK